MAVELRGHFPRLENSLPRDEKGNYMTCTYIPECAGRLCSLFDLGRLECSDPKIRDHQRRQSAKEGRR